MPCKKDIGWKPLEDCHTRYGLIDDPLDANSYDELFEEMKKFFEHACGFTGVEAFEISSPYLEDWEEDDGEEPDMYEWDWDNLRRYQNLSDVWNKVKREIKEEWGKDYFNKGVEL